MPVGVAMTNYLDPMGTTPDGVPAQFIAAGAFEPARNVSEIKSNKESSGDPRMGTTPPTYPLDGTSPTGESVSTRGLCFTEDNYVNNMFFVAWGTVDNEKSTGSSGVKAESGRWISTTPAPRTTATITSRSRGWSVARTVTQASARPSGATTSWPRVIPRSRANASSGRPPTAPRPTSSGTRRSGRGGPGRRVHTLLPVEAFGILPRTTCGSAA